MRLLDHDGRHAVRTSVVVREGHVAVRFEAADVLGRPGSLLEIRGSRRRIAEQQRQALVVTCNEQVYRVARLRGDGGLVRPRRQPLDILLGLPALRIPRAAARQAEHQRHGCQQGDNQKPFPHGASLSLRAQPETPAIPAIHVIRPILPKGYQKRIPSAQKDPPLDGGVRRRAMQYALRRRGRCACVTCPSKVCERGGGSHERRDDGSLE